MKMTLRATALLGVLAAFLAIMPMASALAVEGLPNYMVFKEEPVTASFSVANDSGADAAFSFSVLSPAKYEVVGALPASLKKGEKAQVELRLAPPSGMQGQYYFGKIIFALGAEKAEREIVMNFLPAEGCTIDFTASAQRAGNGMALSVLARNNSVESKSFELKRLEKVPSDWAAQNAAEASLGGQETKSVDFSLTAQSAFKGKGIAVFACAGKEAKAEFSADYNGTPSAFTGLVAGIGGKNSRTLALNIALFIIAVMLVLAFASRYLKRIGRK